MAVGPVSAQQSIAPPIQSSQGQASDSQDLSEMFLQLLLKELSNQSPLNPMDGAAFVDQLAQLAILEQMRTVNANLKAGHDLQQITQANALLGRNIRAPEPDGSVIEGQVMAVELRDSEIMLDVDGLYSIPLSEVSEISVEPAMEEMLGETLVNLLLSDIAAPVDVETWFDPYQTEAYQTEV